MSVATVLGFLEGPELLIVLAVILILFGGAKLPQLARSLGSAQREFKKGLSGDDEKSSNTSKSVNTSSEGDSESSDKS